MDKVVGVVWMFLNEKIVYIVESKIREIFIEISLNIIYVNIKNILFVFK